MMKMKQIIALPDRQPTLRLKSTPQDANQDGDIFGGWLLANIDVAGGLLAAERAQGRIATVAVKDLRFLKPVFIYDVVSFYTDIITIGTTSLSIGIEVYAQRAPLYQEVVKISYATVIYVAVAQPGVKRVLPSIIH